MKHKKGKKSIVLFVIEVVILLTLVGGIFVYAKINQGLRNIGTGSGNRGSVSANDPNLDADKAGENLGITDAQTLHGYTNIALVGIDTRDSKNIDYSNSDTMLIASINNDTKKVRLVSVYRDTLLNIDPDGAVDQGGDASAAEGDDEAAVVGDEDDGDEEEVVEDDGTDEDDAAYDGDEGDSYDDGDDDYDGSDDYDGGDSDSNDGDYDDSDTYNDYDGGDDDQQAVTTEEVPSEENASSEGKSLGGTYNKANAAYCNGSAKQLLTMLNRNLDLDIHDYVVVDFKSMVTLIDDIGGLDMDLLHDEVVFLNDYCKETSRVTDTDYEPLKVPKDDGQVHQYHLNGVQAVSYARIRYTAGNDPKRTQRQRVVIQKIIEKSKKQGLNAVTAVINDVLPLSRTSLSNSEIIQMASSMMNYEIEKTTGFPFEMLPKDVEPAGRKLDAVVPVTLARNVTELHEFLFDEKDYIPTETVRQISDDIVRISNLDEDDLKQAREYGTVPSIGGETDRLK
jgi:LCP family protein required for cell wall assembly